MTEQVEETARVNQEWPARLKEDVQSRVGRRGLTEFTIMAVQRSLDEGAAELSVELTEARDLVQRLANVLATVVDHEARLTFLSSVVLPEWVDTRSWPDEVLSRLDVQVSPLSEEAEPEPEAVLDEVPEMKKVESITTTRVEPKPEPTVGTAEEPVIIAEGKINAMDGPKYAQLQHVHSPDGRCLKNLFIEKGEDDKKHCPLVDETPVAEPLPQASGDNLFERLKQAGHLKPASEIPTPDVRPEEPVVPPAPILVEQTAVPDSGPLPPIPEEAYAPDAVPLEPAPVLIPQEAIDELGEVPEMPGIPGNVIATPGVCPECGSGLDDGMCWNCGYAA